jgi:hypothetical protein
MATQEGKRPTVATKYIPWLYSRGSKPTTATQTANTPNVAIETANLLWLHEQQICLLWLPTEGAKVITQEVWTANDWATQGQA